MCPRGGSAAFDGSTVHKGVVRKRILYAGNFDGFAGGLVERRTHKYTLALRARREASVRQLFVLETGMHLGEQYRGRRTNSPCTLVGCWA